MFFLYIFTLLVEAKNCFCSGTTLHRLKLIFYDTTYTSYTPNFLFVTLIILLCSSSTFFLYNLCNLDITIVIIWTTKLSQRFCYFLVSNFLLCNLISHQIFYFFYVSSHLNWSIVWSDPIVFLASFFMTLLNSFTLILRWKLWYLSLWSVCLPKFASLTCISLISLEKYSFYLLKISTSCINILPLIILIAPSMT